VASSILARCGAECGQHVHMTATVTDNNRNM